MISTYLFVFLFAGALGLRYGAWTLVAFSVFVLAVLFALHSWIVAGIGLVLFQGGYLAGAALDHALAKRTREAGGATGPGAEVVLLSARRRLEEPGEGS